MDWRMERQAPFLKSVLQEAGNHKRQELLRMANADQINAISELVMDMVGGTVPRSRHPITSLKAHAQSLRAVAKPAHSVKRRRAIMMSKKGGNLWSELYRCYKRCIRSKKSLSCTMDQEMVSTPVDNAPAFLQLQDKYKQELVEDNHLTKAADLAAKQHVVLASGVPDAWKRPQLKAVGRQLRHWTKKYVNRLVPRLVDWVEPGNTATPTGEDDTIDTIGQDGPGYKTKCLSWGTIQTRQKTTRTTQTHDCTQCQKETSIHS